MLLAFFGTSTAWAQDAPDTLPPPIPLEDESQPSPSSDAALDDVPESEPTNASSGAGEEDPASDAKAPPPPSPPAPANASSDDDPYAVDAPASVPTSRPPPLPSEANAAADAPLQAGLFSSVGFVIGVAAPLALAGLSALVLFSALEGNADPATACGVALLSIFGIAAGLVGAGPLGVCGAAVGGATVAYGNDRSLLPMVIGVGAGLLALVGGGVGVGLGAVINDRITGIDPTLSIAVIALPAVFYAAGGIFTVLGIVATEVILDDPAFRGDGNDASGFGQRLPAVASKLERPLRPTPSAALAY